MLRSRVTPPPAPMPIVLLDEQVTSPGAAVASRLGSAAYTTIRPGADDGVVVPLLRPEFARSAPAPVIGPQSRQRLRVLLAKVDRQVRQSYAGALTTYREATALLANRKEIAADFRGFGVESTAAMVELREATEAHQVAEQQLRAASQALHQAVVDLAERERVAAVKEAERRAEEVLAAQQEHAAAATEAESAERLLALLRDRPKSALEQALVEEGR